MVVEKTTGQVIGAAGYNVRDTGGRIELVYHFSKVAGGKATLLNLLMPA